MEYNELQFFAFDLHLIDNLVEGSHASHACIFFNQLHVQRHGFGCLLVDLFLRDVVEGVLKMGVRLELADILFEVVLQLNFLLVVDIHLENLGKGNLLLQLRQLLNYHGVDDAS